jgi:hypothetical protein
MGSMPFTLTLPEPWAARGWRVKIRDRERLEPPHVTILHRTRAWRLDLRSERMLDKAPDPRDVPKEILDEIRKRRALLCQEWNRMFPENPVAPREPDHE